MVKVTVTGACGRMGRRVVRMVVAEKDMELVGAVERKEHPSLNKDIGGLLGLGETGIILQEDLKHVIKRSQVIIDFTTPEATLSHLRLAAKEKKGMVIGTTGFSNEELSEIESLADSISCLLSPNMSLGMNVLFAMLENVARALGSRYDIEIIESHHRHKKDSPSGTAKKIAEILACAREVKPEKMIGRIHSLRSGGIVGEHIIIFAGEDERVELIHRAESRDTFARGAIHGAKFIARASPGLYTMKDVLKGLMNNL